MSLRILIVDDDEEALINISSKLEGGLVENLWDAPVDVHKLHSDQHPNPDELTAIVRGLAEQRWDALLVDVNLYKDAPKDLSGLMLPIQLVSAFREKNQSAIALIFSGNIGDHLRDLFSKQDANEASGIKRQVESHVRSIIKLGIVDFSRRDKVAEDAIGHLCNPPWLLRLERELLRTPTVAIEASTLSRLGLSVGGAPITFAAIAEFVRQPGARGTQIAQIASELGTAALADLYA